jgi:hypothetical protein
MDRVSVGSSLGAFLDLDAAVGFLEGFVELIGVSAPVSPAHLNVIQMREGAPGHDFFAQLAASADSFDAMLSEVQDFNQGIKWDVGDVVQLALPVLIHLSEHSRNIPISISEFFN